ncbi:MAG: hypothetical protein ACPIOQ_15635, partial [Promethearchaeia archaeon]
QNKPNLGVNNVAHRGGVAPMRALGIIYTAGNVLQNNTVCTYSKPPQHCVCASRMGCVVDAHDALLSTVESALLPGSQKGECRCHELKVKRQGRSRAGSLHHG